MCLWEHCPSVFPALSAEGIRLPLTPTLYTEEPGDMRRDSLHALRIKGQNLRQNMSNYLFVSPLQYEKEISGHLQSWSSFFIVLSATAVAAVQFLCNFGAALQEKYLLMCMSCLLASFFISSLSVLDYFALLDLTRFCVPNVVRKDKYLSLWHIFPHPLLCVQEF